MSPVIDLGELPPHRPPLPPTRLDRFWSEAGLLALATAVLVPVTGALVLILMKLLP